MAMKEDIKFSFQAGIFCSLGLVDLPGQNQYDIICYLVAALNFLQAIYHNHKLGYC